jgi:hypothetical protein
MIALLVGSAVLSLFHALIPSHWLPVVAIAKKEHWPIEQTLRVTFLAGCAHVFSTLLLGLGFYWLGRRLDAYTLIFTDLIAPLVLVVLGVSYIYRHYYHHHFHLNKSRFGLGVIASLSLAMFLSPCLEIEGYFLAAGSYSIYFVSLLAFQYAVLSVGGMVAWVWLAMRGMRNFDWHALEHNAGLITGLTLVASGLLLRH